MSDERLNELFHLIVRGEHPAIRADRRWRRLLTTWQVFEGNFAELTELIRAYEDDPRVHMRVMYEPPVGDLEYRERFFDELTRRWHNYVGSAMTYLDHERVFIGRESEEFAESVRARYAATLDVSPAVHFTRKLRNFIMHVGWPPSQATMIFTKDSASHHILLSSEKLQDSGFEWSRLACEYMDGKSGEFSLVDSVSDFALELGEFHDWLCDRYWDEHGDVAADYENLVAEYESLGGVTSTAEDDAFTIWEDEDLPRIPEDEKLLLTPGQAVSMLWVIPATVLKWAINVGRARLLGWRNPITRDS